MTQNHDAQISELVMKFSVRFPDLSMEVSEKSGKVIISAQETTDPPTLKGLNNLLYSIWDITGVRPGLRPLLF